MADAKLTALTAASALAAADLFYVSQSAASRKATGTQLLTLVGTTYVPLAGGTMTGALTLPAGAVGAPSLMFTGSAATTGIYTPAADQVAISISGTRRFMVSASNGVSLANTTIDNSGNITSGGSYIKQGSTAYVGWTGSADPTSAVTLSLYEDASDVLAQRRSTNAQTLRVYGTYTDSSNYERLSLATVAGSGVTIGVESLGTGADNLNCTLNALGSGQIRFGMGSGAVVTILPTGQVNCNAVKTTALTVATLQAAATAGAGARAFVTDANATTFNSVVAAGGANAVPVVSDGTNWLIG